MNGQLQLHSLSTDHCVLPLLSILRNYDMATVSCDMLSSTALFLLCSVDAIGAALQQFHDFFAT